MTAIQKLLDAMEERPLDFVQDLYTLIDTKTGVEIWIANGFWYYGIWLQSKTKFHIMDKIRFRFAFKRWQLRSSGLPARRI